MNSSFLLLWTACIMRRMQNPIEKWRDERKRNKIRLLLLSNSKREENQEKVLMWGRLYLCRDAVQFYVWIWSQQLKCHKMFIAVRLNAKKWAQFFLPFCIFNIIIFLAFNASTFLSQLVFNYHFIIFHFQLLWHQLRREVNKKSAWRKNWKGAFWSPAYIY